MKSVLTMQGLLLAAAALLLAGFMACGPTYWEDRYRPEPRPEERPYYDEEPYPEEAYPEEAYEDPEPVPEEELVAVEVAPPPPPQHVVAKKHPRRGFVWVPGHWRWHSGAARHAWVPGHWKHARRDRVWLPARWKQTPRGWVFIRGRWK